MALQVIGPGFGRTGTHAVKLALEQLGFGPCHHMYEVRDNPSQIAVWAALASGQDIDWESVFAGYASQMDWPGARYWKSLARRYPGARVILTVRDPDAWYESMLASIIPLLETRGTHPPGVLSDLLDMGHATVAEQVFGGRLHSRDHAIRVFREHIAQVQAEVPAERLLTYDVRQGWKPMCDFLEVECPNAPFPNTNSSRSFSENEWKAGPAQPGQPDAI